MATANELLKNDEYQVQKVSQLLGLRNSDKFSKAFEADNGMLPLSRLFRNEH